MYEVLVVLVIIGLLAILLVPNISGMKERSLSREVKGTLKLIAAAQKNYRLDTSTFYDTSTSVSDVAQINSNLSLSVSNATWDYSVTATDTGFTVTANRVGSGGYRDCAYTLSYNTANASNPEEPTGNSNCP